MKRNAGEVMGNIVNLRKFTEFFPQELTRQREREKLRAKERVIEQKIALRGGANIVKPLFCTISVFREGTGYW